MAKEEARRQRRTTHGPLGARVPAIERYVQSHVVSALGHTGVSDEPTRFDGYSSCWFRDRSAFEEALKTPEWAALPADSPNLFDDTCWDGWSAALDPRTIVDGEEAPFKTVWFVRFKPEIRSDPERSREAHELWIARHGGVFGVEVPGIRRYVQNHVTSAIDGNGENPAIEMDFDGFSECWFDDRAGFELAMSSDEWLRMNGDADTVG